MDKLCTVKMELAKYKEDKEDYEVSIEMLQNKVKKMEETISFKDKEIINLR